MNSKLVIRKIEFAVLLLMTVFMSASCGKDKGIDDKYLSYEHCYGNVTESAESGLDEEGFYATDDYVYICTEDAVILSAASDDAVTEVETSYAMELHRNGYNDNFSRFKIEDTVYYINNNYITTLALADEDEFDYSITALSIVATDGYFYTYDDCVSDLLAIRDSFSSAVKLNVIGLTEDNRNIYEIVIGNEDAENSILLVGGMEGLEYMTSEYAVKTAEYYAYYYTEGIYHGYTYADVLKNCCLRIIPMINPDGVSISQLGLDGTSSSVIQSNLNSWFERDQSKGGIYSTIENYLMFYYSNANGVDLQYNFPFNWDGAGTSHEPSNAGYKGASAASEPESKAVLAAIERHMPDVIINLRTSGCTIVADYNTTDNDKARASELLTLIAEESGYNSGSATTLSGSFEGYCGSTYAPTLRINVGNGDAPLSTSEFNSIWNSLREVPIALCLDVMGSDYSFQTALPESGTTTDTSTEEATTE